MNNSPNNENIAENNNLYVGSSIVVIKYHVPLLSSDFLFHNNSAIAYKQKELLFPSFRQKLHLPLMMKKDEYSYMVNTIDPYFKLGRPDESVVVSDMKGNSYFCEVILKECFQEIRNVDSSDLKAKDNLCGRTIATYPCTSATFGPSNINLLALTKGIEVRAVLHAPDPSDPLGCDYEKRDSLTSNFLDDSEYQNPNSNKHRRIQIVRRGNCSFKTKVQNQAFRYGATAVIVINENDQNIFVMSEAADMKIGDLDDKQLPVSVLVSRKDGDQIIDIMRMPIFRGREVYIDALVRLRPQLSDIKNIKNSHSEGRISLFPIVSSTPTDIKIVTSSGWGVHAVQNDLEWKLFIINQ